MPWQSGNDNGKGPNNPWGAGPGSGGGGKRPEGLDQMFKRGQDWFNMGSSGGDQAKTLWTVLGVALALLWLATATVYQVDNGELAVVQRFGAYNRTESPGLHIKAPAPIETKTIQEVTRVNQITIGGSGETQNLVLTGDQNLVAVTYTVRWRIKNAKDFQFRLRSPADTIKEVAESVTRQVIARATMDAATGAERGLIASQITDIMQGVLDRYGAGVSIEVFLNNVDPPEKVLEAFRQVTAAQQEAKTSVNQANAYRRQRLAQALGEAARFNAVYEQFKQAPGPTRSRIYLETMENILAGANKVVVDGKGIVPYLPLPQLQPIDKNQIAVTPSTSAGGKE